MKSPELTEFFSLLGKAKKEKKEEFDNLLKEADINLDVLTSTVVTGIKEAKVNIKKQKKKEEKLIEQLDSIIDVIENPKEVKDITEPAVTVGVPEDFDVSTLEDSDDNPSFEVVDLIKPEPIKTPEISDTVAKAIKFIEETNLKEEIENSDETSVDNLKAEIKQVRDILYKVLAHGPGSGEVNLLKLDDVDEDSAKVDGKFLKYESSSGKFVGGDASGGAGIGTNGSVNTVGIITAAQFSGFSHLIAPHSSTKTITVKVASKIDGEHRYYGTGSGQGYVLDNVQSPFLTLTPGRTYRFDVSDSSNSSHPFRFYLDAAKATAYTTGVTVGSGYVDLEVTDSTPTILHYQCSSHGYMGNAIQVNSSNAIKLNSQAASYYLDYDNFSNTPTIPSNNNQLTNGAGFITNNLTGNFTVSGNVDIGGVLTYEDVTNVDSIGLITARNGVVVGSGITLSKDGDVFATGITSSTKVHVGVDTGVYGEDLVVTGDARVTGILTIGTGSIVLDPTAKQLRGLEEIVIGIANTITIKQDSKGEIEFTDAVGTPKSVGIGTTVSVNTSGIITASSFVGDLTGTASNATTAANAVTLNDLAGSHYLNASNLSSGTIPDARFPSALPAIDGSALTGIANTSVIFTDKISLGDNERISVGLTSDLNIYHDGTHSFIQKADGTGNLYVDANGINFRGANAEALASFVENGAASLYYDNTKRFETSDSGVEITGDLETTSDVKVGSGITLSPDGDVFTTGISTFTGTVGFGTHVTLQDDAEIRLGEREAGGTRTGDFIIRHDPSMFGSPFNVIQSNNGNIQIENRDTAGATRFLYLKSDQVQLRSYSTNESFIDTKVNQWVKLFYNNSEKLATTDTGINITGTAVATSFTGDLTGDVTGTASNATLAVSAQGLTGSPNITVTDVNAVDAVISGNLSVAGTITSLDQNDISVTGIMTASAGVDLGDPGIVTLSSDTLTTTSTSTDTVSSISATVFRSATFQVQVTRGTQYHMTTINVIHNGTVAFMSEYGTIRTGAVLATFDTDINSGNLRLRATPTSADSTVFKLSKTTIKV